MILTALEADLVEGVSAGHLGLGRVHRPVAHRALGRLGRLERHPEESCTSEGGDDEQSTEEEDQIWPHLLPRPVPLGTIQGMDTVPQKGLSYRVIHS